MELNEQNLLIHIGYHKTGSTWLQKNLFVTGDEIFEPLSKHSHGQSSLGYRFIKDNQGYLLNPFDLNTNEIQDQINQVLEKKSNVGNKILVLSHERLSGDPDSGGFDSLSIADRLSHVFPNAKVLIMIREQKSFIVSNYFQYLSSGGVYGVKKYLSLAYDGKQPGFAPGFLNYKELITYYRSRFGTKHVLVLPYEMFRDDKSNFFDQLSSFLGKRIKIPEAILMDFKNRKSHHFVSVRLRHLNIFRKPKSLNASFLSNKISMRLADYFITSMRIMVPAFLDRNEIERITKYVDQFVGDGYESHNKDLESLIGMELHKYGYYA